ncbi:MAG: leucine-rich repeat domain-containing protein [Clostridia bacterium]|nr:leucine-rich repeat domain-containing protein [Clostridia bacterium]
MKKISGEYSYIIVDGGAQITGYSGTELELTIPESIDGIAVLSIAPNAFYDFPCLEKVVIPDTVENISSAFVRCGELRHVIVGKGVRDISGAFADCVSLTDVDGFENVEFMADAFRGCTSLRKAKIPSGVLNCDGTFSGCASLTEVEIAEGVAELVRTFENCTSLERVCIARTVTRIEEAFSGCTSLISVSGNENVSEYRGAFRNCRLLKTVSLGRFVTDILDAFTGCTSLESVMNFPYELETYSASFGGCISLPFIRVPKIRNPESERAYRMSDDFRGCRSLRMAVIDCAAEPDRSFCAVFRDCDSLETLTVPEQTLRVFTYPGYIISDSEYTGSSQRVLNLLKKYQAQPSVRVTENYGTVDGTGYSAIYGAVIDAVDPEDELSQIELGSFSEYTETSYWIGFDPNQETQDRKIIERTFLFCLVLSGGGSEFDDRTVYINGLKCYSN